MQVECSGSVQPLTVNVARAGTTDPVAEAMPALTSELDEIVIPHTHTPRTFVRAPEASRDRAAPPPTPDSSPAGRTDLATFFRSNSGYERSLNTRELVAGRFDGPKAVPALHIQRGGVSKPRKMSQTQSKDVFTTQLSTALSALTRRSRPRSRIAALSSGDLPHPNVLAAAMEHIALSPGSGAPCPSLPIRAQPWAVAARSIGYARVAQLLW